MRLVRICRWQFRKLALIFCCWHGRAGHSIMRRGPNLARGPGFAADRCFRCSWHLTCVLRMKQTVWGILCFSKISAALHRDDTAMYNTIPPHLTLPRGRCVQEAPDLFAGRILSSRVSSRWTLESESSLESPVEMSSHVASQVNKQS